MKERYATLMGLNEDTPFVIGASDGVLSNLGVNSVGKGEVAVTIGTSGAIPNARGSFFGLTLSHKKNI